jgi:hypothetical protein
MSTMKVSENLLSLVTDLEIKMGIRAPISPGEVVSTHCSTYEDCSRRSDINSTGQLYRHIGYVFRLLLRGRSDVF